MLHTNPKPYRYAALVVTMTDRDVIERAAALLGSPVQVIRPSGISKKTGYRAALRGQRAVRAMLQLQPLMGERRRGQIQVILDFEANRPDANASRRAWSSAAAAKRQRDNAGRLL